MTKAEREAQLKADMEAMLETIPTQADFKDRKKAWTKLSSKLDKKISSAYYKKYEIENRSEEIIKSIEPDFDKETGDLIWSPEYRALWNIRFASRLGRAEDIEKYENALLAIKDTYPEFHAIAKAYLDEVREYAEFMIKTKTHLTEEEARLKGNTAEQFLAKAIKSKEISDEKRKAMVDYLNTLGRRGWEKAKIEEGKILVNGKPYEEGELVGVMIGSGVRVHPMRLEIVEVEDKESGKMVEKIGIRNYSQWRNSPLVILDLAESIPQELFSEA